MMDCLDLNQTSDGLITVLFIPFVASVLGFFIGAKFSKLSSWLRKWFGFQKTTTSNLEEDATEIKKIMCQVVKDWIEITKVISQIQDNQNNFAEYLQSLFKTESEVLRRKISLSLEEEFLRNDQRFGKMKKTIKSMQDDIFSMNTFLQTMNQKLESGKADEGTVIELGKMVENFAQTQRDRKIKSGREGHKKNVANGERETSKLVVSMKKSITNLMKDVKIRLSIDREEENRELEAILRKLHEDREDIKHTILQAFLNAFEQAKNNFEKFGNIGLDTMKYLAMLHDNTNKLLKSKLEEMDTSTKDIANSVNRQILESGKNGETLKNIENQFKEVLQRIEKGCEINKEHCEKITQSLDMSSNNCLGVVIEVNNLANMLTDDSKKLTGILKEIKILLDDLRERDAENKPQNIKSDIVHGNSSDIISAQDISHQLMLSWERMTTMSSGVENRSQSICELIDGLEQKLRYLNASLGRLDDIVQIMSTESLTNRASGDAPSHTLFEFKNDLSKATSAPNVQSIISLDNVENVVDDILQKVMEKRNLNSEKSEFLEEPSQVGVIDVKGLAAGNE